MCRFDFSHAGFEPLLAYADLTPLLKLNAPTLNAVSLIDSNLTQLDLTNIGSSVAFFVRCRLVCNARDVLPATWSHNFVTLLPGDALSLVVTHTDPCPVTQLQFVVEPFSTWVGK